MADEGATWDDLALRLTANFIDYEDYPTSGSLLVEVRDGVGTLELPRGKQGAPGPPGRAAAPFEGVVSIATASALPASPTEAQKKTAYVPRDTGVLWAWDQPTTRWVDVGLFRGPVGPAGAAPRIVAGGIAATDPGTDPDQWFEEISPGVYQWHMTVPRGESGPEGPEGAVGPSASIASASDVRLAGSPTPGDVLTFGDDGRWYAGQRTAPAGPWTPEYTITPGLSDWDSGFTAREMFRVQIPAQPFRWRPRVSGAWLVGGRAGGLPMVTAAIGSASGPTVAASFGVPDAEVSTAALIPDYGHGVTPTGAGGIVARGVAAEIVVSLRNGDSGEVRLSHSGGGFVPVVYADPVLQE